ncbi:MAG TPA: hypothetical protein VFW78_12255 [Bacteroidia bacterium]|nr:hypothetical protein [Bacteroidia bacterium]
MKAKKTAATAKTQASGKAAARKKNRSSAAESVSDFQQIARRLTRNARRSALKYAGSYAVITSGRIVIRSRSGAVKQVGVVKRVKRPAAIPAVFELK